VTGKTEKKPLKMRLDAALVQRGLATSREKAQALIMAGEVRVDGQLVDKADFRVTDGHGIDVVRDYPYASRGAFKLERALERFAVDPSGLTVLDVGISNGGFADFLLQRGAARVVGVDVNIAQVDERLRRDPRVRLLEKNARFLTAADVPERPDLVVADLSFISVTKVLPALAVFSPADMLVMIKPQFEAERGRVGKGGVVRDAERRGEILLNLKHRAEELGFTLLNVCPAGIRGKKGNQEYFFHLRVGCGGSIHDTMLIEVSQE
jgi:23S rRNA (cytidine1920-2'-O)/16S rRNA (cytidine1409-2'-O)-methyltransferase